MADKTIKDKLKQSTTLIALIFIGVLMTTCLIARFFKVEIPYDAEIISKGLYVILFYTIGEKGIKIFSVMKK